MPKSEQDTASDCFPEKLQPGVQCLVQGLRPGDLGVGKSLGLGSGWPEGDGTGGDRES